MALQVYNVRTRRKEPFVPRDPRRVGLYVCGLTVYDHVHIGHARTYVAFEVVRRWLEHRHGHVHHVMNVTDVDDKIVNRARERGVSPRAHAAEWDANCRAELETLGIQLPTGADYPHVTTSIPDILRFIASIVANGFAYVTPAGNVYFDVPGYDAYAASHLKDSDGRPCGYGSLSNRDYREMAAGTRKEVESDKRHPADFALWKGGDAGDHPDASWDPAHEAPDVAAAQLKGIRAGRPGWHIECSLMATRSLGDTFDLHGGGQDLIFPHHENEVAQSQAKTGKAPFVNVWMHTGFLNVEGEKMSKSLNNFITLQDALQELGKKGSPPAVLRAYFLLTHYRSKIDFTWAGLEESAKAVSRLGFLRLKLKDAVDRERIGCADRDVPLLAAADALQAAFGVAMDDDFHTPGALAALFDFQRTINPILEGETPDSPVGTMAAKRALDELERCGAILTLFTSPVERPGQELGSAPPHLVDAARGLGIQPEPNASASSLMATLLTARTEARAAKDWKRSDAIRNAAKDAGYLIEDTPGGPRWRKA